MTTNANHLEALLRPLADSGNYIATNYLARLEAAEDKDAEAAAIVEDIAAFIRLLAKAGQQLIEAVGAWLLDLAKITSTAPEKPTDAHVIVNLHTGGLITPGLMDEVRLGLPQIRAEHLR